ncbi:hypothetical protein [Micromonospora sp. NPDC005652]|uniref:hypothetical protein n=1 Tax=Micromonospora sp. NPDC005652 TaxID=3157046 RepID=UPI0033C021F2
MTQVVLTEPADRHYVMVGENPHEVVAVRHDTPDARNGEWYRLTGQSSGSVSFADLLGAGVDGARPPVVALYPAAQAIEELALPMVRVAFERWAVASASAQEPGERKQFAQMANALQLLAGDIAAHYGLPAPVMSFPSVPAEAGPDDTQLIHRPPADIELGEVPASEAVTEVLPAVRPDAPAGLVARLASRRRQMVLTAAAVAGRLWRRAPRPAGPGRGRHRMEVRRLRRALAALRRPVGKQASQGREEQQEIEMAGATG